MFRPLCLTALMLIAIASPVWVQAEQVQAGQPESVVAALQVGGDASLAGFKQHVSAQ